MPRDDRLTRYRALFDRKKPGYLANCLAAPLMRQIAERHFRGRLLDIGCGTKRMKILFGDLVSDYIGLDHPDTRHGTSEIDLFGSALELPCEDESFDCVLSTAVLEHLEDPKRAIEESFRVLKPGGIALYSAPFFWHLHEAPRDFFRFTRYGFDHLFSSSGFEIVEITALSGFWVTFLSELDYYLNRFARGPLIPLIRSWTFLSSWVAPRLDRGIFRDERFSWAFVVVARKPLGESGSLP